MFFEQSNHTSNILSLKNSRLWVRPINALFMVGLLLHFAYFHSTYTGLLALVALVYLELSLNIGKIDSAFPQGFPPFFRVPVPLPELRALIGSFCLVVFFFLLKSVAVVHSQLFPRVASNTIVGMIVDNLSNVCTLYFPGRTFLLDDWLIHGGLLSLVSGLILLNRGLRVKYDNLTVQIIQIFFNRKGILISFALLLGVVLTRQVMRVTLSVVEIGETIFVVFFLTKTFGDEKEPGLRVLLNWTNFFRRVCIAKLLAFVTFVLVLNNTPWLESWTAEEQSNSFVSKLLVDQTQLSSTIFWTVVVYLFYLYISFSIRVTISYGRRSGSPHLPHSHPYRTQFISYFVKHITRVCGSNQISVALNPRLMRRANFLKPLRQNPDFKHQFEYSLRTEKTLGVEQHDWRPGFYASQVLKILMFYKHSFFKLVVNSLFVVYLAFTISEIGILSVCLFVYTLLIVRVDSFKVIWTASWAFCITPAFLTLVGLCFQVWVQTQLQSSSIKQPGLTEAAEIVRLLLGVGHLTPTSLGFFLNKLIRVLVFNTIFIGARSFINLPQSRKVKDKNSVEDSLVSPKLASLDSNTLRFFRFLFQAGVSTFTFAIVIFLCLNCLLHINGLNFVMVFVTMAYIIWPCRLTLAFICQTNFQVLCFRFLLKILSPVFNISDSFLLISGFGYAPFGTIYGRLDTYRAFPDYSFAQNVIMVYFLFVFQGFNGLEKTSRRFQDLPTDTWAFAKFKSVTIDLWKSVRVSLKKTKLFFLYFYTLYLLRSERDHEEKQLNFLFVMVLLGFHVLILKQRGNLYNKTFIGLLLMYLCYLVMVFAEAYAKVFGRLTMVQVAQPETLANYRQSYHRAVSDLITLGIQILLVVLSLKDILLKMNTKRSFASLVHIDTLQTHSGLSFYLLQLGSIFLKDALLFYIVSKFLIQPNIFKMLYVLFYLRYFFSQFRALGRASAKFRFLEVFEAKLRFFKGNLLNMDAQRPFTAFDFYSPDFRRLNALYAHLFSKRIFTKIYKKVNENWIFNFAVIFVYFVLIHYLNAQRIHSNEKFLILNYFLNWKDTPGFLTEEYQDTLIVLVASIFEVYFVTITNSQFTDDEKKLMRKLPSLLLFRYASLSKVAEATASTGEIVRMEEERMTSLLNRAVTNPKVRDFPLPPIQPSADYVQNLNDFIPSDQKFILLSYIRSKLCCLQVVYAFLHVLLKAISVPILLGLLTDQISFFDLSLFVLVAYFYLGKNSPQALDKMNFMLAIFSFLDYLLMYMIDCRLMDKISWPLFRNTFFLVSHCMPVKVLRYLIQYIAILKLYFVLCTFACQLLMVHIDSVDQTFYTKIQTQVIRGKAFLNINYADWTAGPHFFFYKLKKNLLAVIGDLYAILLMVHFYADSSWPSVLCFVVLASYKLFKVFQAKQTMNDLVDRENTVYFLWLSVFNVALLGWHKWSLKDGDQVLSPANKALFVIVILASVLIVDCCASDQLQEEKTAAEGYFKVMNHLVVLNQVYAANEHKLLSHVKQSIKFQHLDGLVKKKPKEREARMDSEKILSVGGEGVKTTHKKYKRFLEEQVSALSMFVLQIKKKIRKKMSQTSCSSLNFMAIVATYIEKNHAFLPSNYEINLPRIINGDFKAIEVLISMIEENKASILREMKTNYVESVLVRIEEGDFAATLHKRRMSIRGLMLTTVPSTPMTGNHELRRVAKGLFSELSLNMIALKMAETKDNNFGDNFVKFYLSPDKYFLIWRYDDIRYQVREVEYWKTTFLDNLRAVAFVLVVRVEEVVSLVLVVLFCTGYGISAAICIFVILFFICVEDRITNLQMWKYLYLFFMLGFMVLLGVHCFNWHKFRGEKNFSATWATLNMPFEFDLMTFMYGANGPGKTVAIFIIMELTIALLSRSADWNKTVNEIENPSQTYFRLAIQRDGFVHLFNDRIQLSVSNLNGLESHVKQKHRKKLNERDYTVFLINLIKRKTRIYRHVRDRFANYLHHVRGLLPMLKHDAASLKPANFRSYLWRNFSYAMRKRNVDVHDWLVGTLVLTIAYYFFFYFRLIRSSHGIGYLFEYNEVDLTLGLPITLLLFFLLVEQYLYFHTCIYWIESARSAKDVVAKHLNRLDLTPDTPSRSKVLRLRNIFRTTLICARLRTPTVENFTDDYRHNPMLIRLYSTLIYFLGNTFLVFFWIPLASNMGISEKIGTRLFCTKALSQTQACNSVTHNPYLQVYYFLTTLFCLISAYQIRNGFSTVRHFKARKFKSPTSLLVFYVLDNLPFFKEIKTIVNYLASYSTLDLFKWFKIEDMQATVSMAQAIAKSKKIPGKEIRGFWKVSASLIAFGIFFLLLISPLYFFSDILLNNTIEEIVGARLKGFIEVDTSRYTFFRSTGFTITKIAAVGDTYQKSRQYEALKRIGNDLLRRVTFERPSQLFFDVNREELKKIITDNWESGKIRMGVELKVVTEKGKDYEVHFPFALEPQTASLFLKVLTSDSCSEYNGLQVTFGASSKFIDLRGMRAAESHEYSAAEYPAFMQLYTMQVKCHKETNKAWFDLFDENSRGISFIVLSENIKNSVQLLKRFSSSKISITSVYIIIFSYFGLTLIRKWCFDNSHKIWLAQMPSADRLQQSLFKISYSRMKANLYEEERYYNKLIDLFRSPEKIKKLTGALHKADS